MTMTVLVIGGTGALGAPVAARLRDDGYYVRVLVRDLRAIRAGGSDFEFVEGDLEDGASLRGALDGCAAVHVSVRGGPTAEECDRVEHRGTARVATLAARAGVGRLTYVSHMLAAPDATAPDLRAKFHAEQAIAASGVPYTIFRPTYFMETLPRLVRGGKAIVPSRQRQPFHLLAAADFARMVSRALTTPDAAGRCLYAHGPQPLTLAEALRIYRDQLAPGTRVVSLPPRLMTVLDRPVLPGERGDPEPANELLGAPTTTLTHWCGEVTGPGSASRARPRSAPR